MDESDSAEERARAVLDRIAMRSARQMAAENFPVALRLLPRRPRTHLARVYAYARFVDDVGDEAPGDRGHLLDLIEADVRAVPTGAAKLPAVSGLQSLVREFGVPLDPLLDLIQANRMDQHTSRYETFDDLLGYCRLSAAPVGRIVLHIAGAATVRNIVESDAVCAGLQVLEHAQDVGEDARAGRIYLPTKDLHDAGASEDELLAAQTSREVRRVIALQVERARDLLRAGHPLVRRLSGWSRLAVAGYVGGGLATATALQAADYDVLGRQIRPARTRTAAHALRLVSPWGRP